MALFGNAVMRLVRTKWKSAQALALEIYALLNGDIPITQDAPVVIRPDPGSTDPGLTIQMPAGSDADPIRIVRGDTTVVLGGEGGSGGGGGTDFVNIDFPGQDPNDQEAATPDPADNPITLWGIVSSKVGGNVYAVRCWAKDPAGAPPIGVLNVTQGLIDTDEEIPEGTPCVVVAFPGTLPGTTRKTILSARMQVPVFLEEPST